MGEAPFAQAFAEALERRAVSLAWLHQRLVERGHPVSPAALSYWRSGELGWRSWLASLRTVDETAWFARDDLRPFGLMCLRMGWRLATRPLSRRERPASRSEPRYRGGRAAPGRDTAGRDTAAGRPQTIIQDEAARQNGAARKEKEIKA